MFALLVALSWRENLSFGSALFSSKGLAEKSQHSPYGSWIDTRGLSHLFSFPTPVGATGAAHPYVSNHDDFTWHPALWHGHVVTRHGSPKPLDSRNPEPRHRDVIPPVCMHHGVGAAHPLYSRCVSLFSTLVTKVFSRHLVPLHAGYPTHKAHKSCNRLWSLRRVGRTTPQKPKSDAGKTTLSTLRRRRVGRTPKLREETLKTHKGRDLG